jgi:hypothetical protein
MDWVRLHPILDGLVIHIPNEGRRSERYGHLLKALGMRPGVSDLFVAMAKRNFNGAWIELKSAKGKVSPEQALFQLDMSKQNYFVSVCWSIDDAINTLKWYCFD